MPMGKIIVNLDVEMAKRKMSLSELAGQGRAFHDP